MSLMHKLRLNWFSFWYSVAFLTRLPAVNLTRALKENNAYISRQSLYYYPLTGALVGLVVVLFALMFQWQYSLTDGREMVLAGILLAVWSFITGGLHLDGLADSGDAWIGGLGNRDKTLAIMKDPYAGPMGVMLMVLALLLKFAALVVLVNDGMFWFLIAVPVLARTAVIPLFYFTPYVREKGLGTALSDGISPYLMTLILFVVAVMSVFIFREKALLIAGVFLAVFMIARNMMMQRLKGTTGDTAGAMIETMEVVLLCAVVL